jgi:DNA-binding transcriptional regulator YiaG
MKKASKKPFHYTGSGLDNVYLLNGYEVDKEGTLYIHNINQLHDAIGLSLIMKSNPLSGEEIRYIRHHLDLSQKKLGSLLGVDYQSVLGWEKNKREITPSADKLLKAYYYGFLNPESNKRVSEFINELSELDAIEAEARIMLEEKKDKWDVAA